MAIMGNLGKKLGDFASSTAKKSGEMIEITKLNMSINSEEDGIKKTCIEIGNYCFGLFEQGPFQDERLNDFCAQIKARKEKIEQLKEKINEVKGISICPNCGAEVQKGTQFCGSCGNKMAVPEPEATEPAADPNAVICPACKATVTGGAAFCSSCGAKVK